MSIGIIKYCALGLAKRGETLSTIGRGKPYDLSLFWDVHPTELFHHFLTIHKEGSNDEFVSQSLQITVFIYIYMYLYNHTYAYIIIQYHTYVKKTKA